MDLSSSPAVARLTVEVTGPGIDPPLIFQLTVSAGQATDTLAIPAGSDRTITIRAFDAADIETHRGSIVLGIEEGMNPGVTVTLLPVSGSQPITVRLGDLFVRVTPGTATLPTGKTIQLTAAVTDAAGDTVDAVVQWGSFNPSRARVDSTGLVSALDTGWVTIAAVAAGAAGSADIHILSLFDLVDGVLGSAYRLWYRVLSYDGPTMALSTASFEHSAPWSNEGMEYYSRIPRVPSANIQADPNVQNIVNAWIWSYDAIDAIHDALTLLGSDTAGYGARGTRAAAYAKFVEGLALGTLAVLYDSAYVTDGATTVDTVHLLPYGDVMTAALGRLNDAAEAGPAMTLAIPASWMSQEVNGVVLAQLARSYRARFRAAVARTPAERAAADWSVIRADAEAGVTEDWHVVYDCNAGHFCGGTAGDMALTYRLADAWQMQANWVAGMADTSGHYQAWMATPTDSKAPFVIHTPDTRWPQGADEAAQLADPTDYYSMSSGNTRIWTRPDRGTWRWSYYLQTYQPFYTAANDYASGSLPEVTLREMRALIAEADHRAGNLAEVATFVNATRTLHGLQATDANGANADCVPRLPNGTCGDLWEMFKWEKRLETHFAGPFRVGWYFDGRGWGDLMEGTLLQLPVPYFVRQHRGQAPYDFGGVGGAWAAPIGTYGY